MEVVLPNLFVPRWYQSQFMAWFDHGGRRSIEVWHRRSGKDFTAMHQTCKMAHRRRGLYWHIFPTEAQGRKAIWQGFTKDGQRLMELVFPKAIRRSPREWTPNAQMVVELKCGSIWRLTGSDRIENVGAGPAGVVFSEFALAKPGGWDYIRPMLRESDGWATFLTTPRGKNHAWSLWEKAGGLADWRRQLLGLRDTGAYPYEETLAKERAEGMADELIDQEYNCSWTAALVGSYYSSLLRELEERGGLREFQHPKDEIFTTWDLGHGDSTAIWWWRLAEPRGSGVEFIDHYESHSKPMSHYFQKVRERPWMVKKHWLPHDARAKTLQTGRSILDMALAEWGPHAVEIVPEIGVQDGIQALRKLLQQKGTRFHPRCSRTEDPSDSDGVECLRAYRKKWDEVRKCFSAEPIHDWSSDSADGARYTAVVEQITDSMTKPVPPRPPPRPASSATLEELHGERERWAKDRGRL